jgi:nucleoside phosphorylase
MILIFVALRAEFHPIRARLTDGNALVNLGLDGCQGRLAGVPVALVATGMGMRRSQISSAQAMDSLREIELVVLSGVAGGLRDDLQVGRVVLGERLFACRGDDFRPEQIIDIPAEWFDRFSAALSSVGILYDAGPMMTSRRPLMTGADKHRAHLESGGAITVDMESAAIALEAQRRGLPFVCMRTILDTAEADIVGAQLVDQNGRVRAPAAAKALISSPRIIIGVAHLWRNLRLATRSMASALQAALPRL